MSGIRENMRWGAMAFAAAILLFVYGGCAPETDETGPPVPVDAEAEDEEVDDEENVENDEPARPGNGEEEERLETVFEIRGDDNMRFDLTTFEVEAGVEVTVILENVGEMPKEAMGHNFVLFDLGTDVNAFAADAVQYPDNAYIPPDREEEVLAATGILGPGETEELTFTAPETPGDYDYACTFPGHTAAGMVGTMTVREPEEDDGS